MAKVIPIVRIVDDDEPFCMSQKMFLQAMGWFVLIYNSAKTFLEDDDPSQPGCLILDMRMPEMTGLELQTALVARGAPLPSKREAFEQERTNPNRDEPLKGASLFFSSNWNFLKFLPVCFVYISRREECLP